MAYSGAQITRLGLAGIPRGLSGSFAGKEEQIVIVPDVTEESTGGWITRPHERETTQQRKDRIREQREELGIIEKAVKPILHLPKIAVNVTKQQAQSIRKLEAEQLRLTQTLESMAEHDTLKRRRVAMLLMLV